MPISAGEAHYGAHDFTRLIEARALDILQPAIISCGGFGEAKAVALIARLHTISASRRRAGAAPSRSPATVHFAASLPVSPHTDHVPYPMLVEYDVSENPLRDALVTRPLAPVRAIPVPTAPGLGIAIDEAAVAAYRKR